MNKKQHLYSLSGLKVIAIWLIFWLHSWLTNPPCDLGARCCEFFFVVSGFLVYYTQKDTSSCTWGDSLRYVKSKLVSIWPMHLLGFILSLCSMSLSNIFSQSTLIRGVINLLLLQSWFNIETVFFSFNGPSWYLSSLLFCYLLTPVLLRMIRNRRKVIIYFPVVFFVRYFIEETQFYYPNTYTDFNIHVSPVLRMFEFFLGMMICSVWRTLTEHLKDKSVKLPVNITFILGSVVEVFLLCITATLFVTKQNSWGRAIFVLYFCFFVLLFAFDSGIVSRFFATKPMRWFAAIQLEFFIFHIPVINLVNVYVAPHGFTSYQLAGITFTIVLVISWLYHVFLKKPAEKLTAHVLHELYHWITS